MIDQGIDGTSQKQVLRIETDPSRDLEATLELSNGTTRVPILFTIQEVDGAAVGYLRLAHGHGNFANRLLGSAGLHAKLATPNGACRQVVITSTEPGEAPGYLCAFSFTPEAGAV